MKTSKAKFLNLKGPNKNLNNQTSNANPKT